MFVKLELHLNSESNEDSVSGICKLQPAVSGRMCTNLSKKESIREIHRKVCESFLQSEVPERPNTGGLSADYSNPESGGVDFGWAISLTDNSPKNFNFESLHCVGQKVQYNNPETRMPSFNGEIVEVIFTAGGQVRYSVKRDSDDAVVPSIWGGWLSLYTRDQRKELESTLGHQMLDDAKRYIAQQLDWSFGDAYHVVDFVLNEMATFCSDRNVHFSLNPLECYAVFLHLIDRQVQRHIKMAEEDTGCDNQYKHLL